MTTMDWKLEVVVLPVADVDRAKAFYLDRVGFDLQIDHRAGESFRVVHLIPRGSAVAVALMQNEDSAGSVSGLYLVVTDIEAARAELVGRGAEPSEVFHFAGGAQQPGPDPDRADYGSFFSLSDPDGNQWMVQEVASRASG
jgi:predicted enzyme related to lactoylglutathione lyase